MRIQVCRGRVFTFRQGEGNQGVGFYRLDPGIEVPDGAKVIIVGATVGGKDITQAISTLDSKHILYVYGESWDDIQIQGKLLLGQDNAAASLESVKQWFESNRVSKRLSPVKLSTGSSGGQYELMVEMLQLGTPDPATHIQPFTIVCKSVPQPATD